MLPKEYKIPIVLQKNFSIAAPLRKKQHNVYDSRTRPIKLVQKKLPK